MIGLTAALAIALCLSLVTHGFATTTGSVHPSKGCTSPYAGRVGFDTHMLWDSSAYQLTQLETLKAAGVTWIRSDFPWEQIGATGPTENWTLTDQLMTSAAKVGIHVLAIVDYSAPWASSDPSGQGNKFYAPNQAAFAKYAADIAARYGPGGTFWAQNPSLPQVPLGAEELWNEPFGWWFWAPNPSPATYGKLAYAAAVAIHDVDPTMTVLASGDLLGFNANNTAFPWLADLLKDEPQLASVINGWSVHPYPAPATDSPMDDTAPTWAFDRVELEHDLLVAHNAAKPIWITEFGWSTATNDPQSVSEQQQSLYLTEGLKTADITWSSFVARSFIYAWDPSSGASGDYQGNFGLVRADGTTKPAWSAIQQQIATVQCGPSVTSPASTAASPAKAARASAGGASAHAAASAARSGSTASRAVAHRRTARHATRRTAHRTAAHGRAAARVSRVSGGRSADRGRTRSRRTRRRRSRSAG